MKTLFRADSSSRIGLGHIMRDLVLAKRLGSVCAFACRPLEGHIAHRIPYPVFFLSTDSPEELIDLIRQEGFERIVFDHYEIDAAFEKRIKEATGIHIVALDDTYENHHCDTLINHNAGARAERYAGRIPEGCRLLCGARHTLVREEFYHAAKRRRLHPKSGRLFVAMGGSDHLGLIPRILRIALSLGFKADIVTTSANPRLRTLKRFVRRHKNRLRLTIDSPRIADIMARCDLALLAPSVSLYEAQSAGLPVIAIQTAPNQSEIVRYLRQKRKPVLYSFHAEKLKRLLKRYR